MRSLVRCLIFVIAASVAAQSAAQAPDPVNTREAAIQRAMDFLSSKASNPAVFADDGEDLMWCFYTIAHTARDHKLRASAARLGRDLAQRWRKANRHVPAHADADTIASLVSAAYTADLFGVHDRHFNAELRGAASRFTAKDYLGFDAPNHPPPAGDPGRYQMWQQALITTFTGDSCGIRLGATYADVVKWLPQMRPFNSPDDDLEWYMFYAITHLIYTLDGYGTRRIAPSLLPEEIVFIKRKLSQALDNEDPEMVGESLDTLKAFGLGNDPLVRQGIEYLLANQQEDGTWIAEEDSSSYTAYHSAWTGIDGLRDYRFRGTLRKLPRLAAK